MPTKQLTRKDRQAQDKFSRYSRYILSHPEGARWIAIKAACIRHFPKNLRAYACDRLMLRTVEMEAAQ
jgi:hypothetical protein